MGNKPFNLSKFVIKEGVRRLQMVVKKQNMTVRIRDGGPKRLFYGVLGSKPCNLGIFGMDMSKMVQDGGQKQDGGPKSRGGGVAECDDPYKKW